MISSPIAFVLLSTTLYTLINVTVKVLALSVFQIMFFRAAISLGLCYWLIRRKGLSFLGTQRRLLLARGVFGTLALLLIWWTMQNLPFAIATVVFNMPPIFAVLIAHIFTTEKASSTDAWLLGMAFLGIVLARGLHGQVSLPWLLVGLAGAVCAALAYTVIRKIKETEDPLVIIAYFPLVTLPLVSPLALWKWQWPTTFQWALLIGIGVTTQVAQYFMTRAFQLRPASEVMIYNYFGLLLSLLLGHFVFHEYLSAVQYLGVALIASALILQAYLKKEAAST